MSIDYYQDNAKKFVEGTINIDVSELQSKFLDLLPQKAHILDAGCGSGRDTKIFVESGYEVTAIDASSELAKIASEYSGIPIQCMKFEDLDYINEFDGIWACASLLHVPRADLHDVFRRLIASLKCKGILYISFKYGALERIHDGRLFNDCTEESLSEILKNYPTLTIIEMWKTADLRPGRTDEYWLNCLVSKHER